MAGEVDLKYATKDDLIKVEERLDRHDGRLLSLEDQHNSTVTVLAVLETKLESVLDAIQGISVTIRNTLITVGIGALIWALVQSQLGV